VKYKGRVKSLSSDESELDDEDVLKESNELLEEFSSVTVAKGLTVSTLTLAFWISFFSSSMCRVRTSVLFYTGGTIMIFLAFFFFFVAFFFFFDLRLPILFSFNSLSSESVKAGLGVRNGQSPIRQMKINVKSYRPQRSTIRLASFS